MSGAVHIEAALTGRPNKRRRRTRAEMASIRQAIIDTLEEDPPMTVRQVFYLLETRGVIEKTEAEYNGVVVRLLTEMRLTGEVPWNYIVDSSRRRLRNVTYDGINEAAERTARVYRRNALDLSPDYIEVWCEKEALAGVISQVTDEFDVPLIVSKGMPSLTILALTAVEINEAAKAGQRSVIYQFGDHDPSGVLIWRTIENRLREMAPDADLTIERVALTPLMIRQFNLPTRPTKRGKNPHAKGFEGDSVELDALKPRTLRGLCRQVIERHIDPRSLLMLREAEESERAGLRAWADQIGGAS